MLKKRWKQKLSTQFSKPAHLLDEALETCFQGACAALFSPRKAQGKALRISVNILAAATNVLFVVFLEKGLRDRACFFSLEFWDT